MCCIYLWILVFMLLPPFLILVILSSAFPSLFSLDVKFWMDNPALAVPKVRCAALSSLCALGWEIRSHWNYSPNDRVSFLSCCFLKIFCSGFRMSLHFLFRWMTLILPSLMFFVVQSDFESVTFCILSTMINISVIPFFEFFIAIIVFPLIYMITVTQMAKFFIFLNFCLISFLSWPYFLRFGISLAVHLRSPTLHIQLMISHECSQRGNCSGTGKC